MVMGLSYALLSYVGGLFRFRLAHLQGCNHFCCCCCQSACYPLASFPQLSRQNFPNAIFFRTQNLFVRTPTKKCFFSQNNNNKKGSWACTAGLADARKFPASSGSKQNKSTGDWRSGASKAPPRQVPAPRRAHEATTATSTMAPLGLTYRPHPPNRAAHPVMPSRSAQHSASYQDETDPAGPPVST